MIKSRKFVITEALVELVIAVVLLIVSVPLWMSFNNTGYENEAEYYSSYNTEN